MGHRQIKKAVADLLMAADLEPSLATLCSMPARQVVNPLFGLLYSGDSMVRWRAVTAMGAVVSKLADENIESARIIMRRFMWNLNDESGGIGWGSPDSMGEIMARHHRLAREYAAMLVSYADPEGNFLEHPGLQQGVLWALGRLGRVYPELVRQASRSLPFFLASPDPVLRGLAVWAAIPLHEEALQALVQPMKDDESQLTIFVDEELKTFTIGQLAVAMPSV